MTKKSVYIVAAKRTPIGKFKGSLSEFSATELGSIVIKELLNQSQIIDTKIIDKVFFGNVIQAGLGQNPARQAGLNAGLDVKIPMFTVNDVCGSGMSSIDIAANMIISGDSDIIIAGGMESMSNAPYLLDRNMNKLGSLELKDSLLNDGLTDSFKKYHMGVTAENILNIAKYSDISRDELDTFALNSHKKAEIAHKLNKFDEEIIEVKLKEGSIFSSDECIRRDTSLEKLRKLNPIFADEGKITAGNSSPINDGAAGIILASHEAVKKYNLKPLAEWKACSSVGINPEFMGLGPIDAIRTLLIHSELTTDDIDLFEINEAFAAQSIACINDLNLNEDIVNINGGAIALGHPLGASGARILVSLIYALKNTNKTIGIASLCVGGGMGIATLIQNVK